MQKQQIIEFLTSQFEPELVNEMINYKIYDFPSGVNLHVFNTELMGYLPFVIEGQIYLQSRDKYGDEFEVYKINPGESCIINLSEIMRNKWGISSMIPNGKNHSMISEKATTLIAFPFEKVAEWNESYLSWQKYSLKLYHERLAELLRQFDVLVDQKKVIMDQNEQITSSIQYAQRIQEAVLTSGWQVEEKLPEHFVIYKPRDIVSDDFYWMSHINTLSETSSKNDMILIAAADCTGHGVPGAFMSMLGISFLNEIIAHYKFKSTDDILNLLRDKIKKSLQQKVHSDSPHDGMDIALCLIDLKNQKLQFSGAYNPLYLFRNNELIELKATKNPIGMHSKEIPFQKNEIETQKGDVFYIFSDGYKSQFGGELDKTFKSKNFKETLLSIHKLDISEQKLILENRFDKWKGENNQTDDVLVIGVQL
ncbi:MAG: SpoIIE family protein phosphatase [Candidatus Kapabacteria bacterium]|nr:SpoIIE family protein phosphatase [Candidatus Kapabacteria bacterium]